MLIQIMLIQLEPQLKVSQNNETDDANLNEFTGPIGKIGPKGVSGNGRLISTIDKNVINKLIIKLTIIY